NGCAQSISSRLKTIEDPSFCSVYLQPALHTQTAFLKDVVVTYWPNANTISPNELTNEIWREIGALLAMLHSIPCSQSNSTSTCSVETLLSEVNQKLELCFGKLTSESDNFLHLVTVAEAWRCIIFADDFSQRIIDIVMGNKTWAHGDFHLGQIVRVCQDDQESLRLIDIDTLSPSAPELDLARPAALFAAGILPGDVWTSFLDSYWQNRFQLTLDESKFWSSADLLVQVLTVKLAIIAINRAIDAGLCLEPTELQIVETCRSIGMKYKN
ncbi:MAG: hypothetical protein NT027_02405, partial [Proteobacteria bacterium]|nr:hypothetical protein [Pseudomonadota bacterium]